MSPLVHVAEIVVHDIEAASGNGISGARDSPPENTLLAKTVFANTETQRQSPTIAGYLPISERLPSSQECVVELAGL